ncbi:DUF3145 domain-containing protein [Vallicoccus soli]|uniref:DUF3145 domain-containing protein n=1 Tax=Vallicoccus soli TaxID=2339232 RepID=A0A3A3Z1D9_9ACTN|nr:DUF3145 domain-containing protein [Vallicoccus soli]RJK96993.1 DUF3145 domain-containing protein [Vallicoccus soli]
MTTRGVVFVHAAPAALCPHVEWALGAVLGMRVSLDWTPQPAAPGTYRAELSWQGRAGLGASLSSALRRWTPLRFEVTEEPSRGTEGERYAYTPDLGLWRGTTGVHGDVLVGEDRLRTAMERAAAGEGTLEGEVRALLGAAWDEELEPFRHAGEGAPVRWLHQVV